MFLSPSTPSRFRAVILALAVFIAAGCEEAVGPTLEDSAQFTLYGALDPEAESQLVRVFAIRDRLEETEAGLVNATMTTTDLATGEVVVWRDSVITLANGRSGDAFVAAFTPAFGRTYQVVVEGETGEPATVVVDVPPDIEPILRTPTFGVNGAAQEVLWPGVARLNAARVEIDFFSTECRRYTFELTEDIAAPIDFGWTVNVPFGVVATQVRNVFDVPASQLAITAVRVEARVASRDWVPPGGVFDPDVLIEPGTFSNVTNGFGFVGASYPSSTRWLPSSEVAVRSGFLPNGGTGCAAAAPSQTD